MPRHALKGVHIFTFLLLGFFGPQRVASQPSLLSGCSPASNLFSGFGGGIFDNFPAFGQQCEEPSSGGGGFGSDLGNLASQFGINTGNDPAADILATATAQIGGNSLNPLGLRCFVLTFGLSL